MRLSAVSSSQSRSQQSVSSTPIGGRPPTLTIQTLLALPRQHQWVLDALLLPLPRAAVSEGLFCRGIPYAQKQQPALCLTLAVGFTDNSVELHALEVPFELTGSSASGDGSKGDAQILSPRVPLMRVRSNPWGFRASEIFPENYSKVIASLTQMSPSSCYQNSFA